MFTASEVEIRNTVSPFDITVALGELHSRARAIVPIERIVMPTWARGLFISYPHRPHLNHIALPFGKESVEEVIVLAHEIGHAENCKYEPDRWAELSPHQKRVSNGIKPTPDGRALLVEEELLANSRAKAHLNEICPGIVQEFNRQMEMSLLTFILRISRMP